MRHYTTSCIHRCFVYGPTLVQQLGYAQNEAATRANDRQKGINAKTRSPDIRPHIALKHISEEDAFTCTYNYLPQMLRYGTFTRNFPPGYVHTKRCLKIEGSDKGQYHTGHEHSRIIANSVVLFFFVVGDSTDSASFCNPPRNL